MKEGVAVAICRRVQHTLEDAAKEFEAATGGTVVPPVPYQGADTTHSESVRCVAHQVVDAPGKLEIGD